MTEGKEKILSDLTRAEKAELLQWIVRDLGDAFPGIDSTPGVVGGAARISRTRIPIWLLERARRPGTSEADLLRDHPTLTAQDLANAWAYVCSHCEDIDEEIAAGEEAAAETKAVITSKERARRWDEWTTRHAVRTQIPVDDSREGIYTREDEAL